MTYLAAVPEGEWLLLPISLLLIALWLLWRTQWRVLAWLLMGISVGGGAMHLKMLDWQASQIADIWFQQPIQAKVMIDGIAKPVTGGWQCDIVTLSAPSPSLTDISLKAYWAGGDTAPVAGQIWSVTMRLSPNDSWRNPGGFDYQAHLFHQGVYAQAKISAHESKQISAQWHWQAWRWRVFSHLQASLPESEFTGLNLALIMGESLLISQAQWQILRETGTLHLAVVSGMHLTLVGSLAGMIALLLWKRFPSERFHAQWMAAWVAWVAASAFAVLAGLNLPVQRAWLMISVVLVAVLLKRQLHPLLLLSWALLLVLIWDITSVMQAGFWLSFLATGALIWLLTSPEGWWWKLIALHLGMSLLLAPLLMIFFQQIPVYSPVANMLAAPVVEWLFVPLLLIAGVLSPVLPEITGWIGEGVDQIWALLWAVLTEIAALPNAILLVKVSAWHWLMLGIWAVLLILWRQHLLKSVGMLLLAIPSVLIPLLPANPEPTETRFILLDTGRQAPVIIWQQGQDSWLLGVGETFGRQHSMDMAILPALTALNIHRLTGVVLWHEDEAADEKGLQALTRYLSVEQIHRYDANCRTQALSSVPWHYQSVAAQCWLSIPLKEGHLWLTPHAPTRLPPTLAAADVILAPTPPSKHSQLKPKLPIRLWLSQGAAVPKAWAREQADTDTQGALYLSIRDKQLILSTEQQLSGRFYHEFSW